MREGGRAREGEVENPTGRGPAAGRGYGRVVRCVYARLVLRVRVNLNGGRVRCARAPGCVRACLCTSACGLQVCMAAEVCATLAPCGHLCACWPCARALAACPICRAAVGDRVRTYL